MAKTAGMIASETLDETLQCMNVSAGITYPAILLRSKTSGQVLYLEADKNFVDTLLSFLFLPVGTIIHLLSTGIQVKPIQGGISRIFESAQNFTASDLRLARKTSCNQDLHPSAALASIVVCHCKQPWKGH